MIVDFREVNPLQDWRCLNVERLWDMMQSCIYHIHEDSFVRWMSTQREGGYINWKSVFLRDWCTCWYSSTLVIVVVVNDGAASVPRSEGETGIAWTLSSHLLLVSFSPPWFRIARVIFTIEDEESTRRTWGLHNCLEAMSVGERGGTCEAIVGKLVVKEWRRSGYHILCKAVRCLWEEERNKDGNSYSFGERGDFSKTIEASLLSVGAVDRFGQKMGSLGWGERHPQTSTERCITRSVLWTATNDANERRGSRRVRRRHHTKSMLLISNNNN